LFIIIHLQEKGETIRYFEYNARECHSLKRFGGCVLL
jgi:hypothetical protein